MATLLAAGLLAAEKSISEEGRDIIVSMLVVGLIFLGVIALGQLTRHLAHKRQARRTPRRL